MDNMLSTLNEYQMRAVIDEGPACLVNAHIGSGKTMVLISKIFYLHRIRGIPFEEMVVLTFTNKAANKLY
jgi:DNA helicase-2/ATP-dependent DNA helicase PcrA